mmetsp:Transcript_5567/g.14727  ORF Transcript_5567/g.14727 Transcript_5567/m.14727 type:complete len:87 (+) Transcript_5567:183-443(+)
MLLHPAWRRLKAKYGNAGLKPKRGLLGAKEKKYFDSADHSMAQQSASPSAPGGTPPGVGGTVPAGVPQHMTPMVMDEQPEAPPSIR